MYELNIYSINNRTNLMRSEIAFKNKNKIKKILNNKKFYISIQQMKQKSSKKKVVVSLKKSHQSQSTPKQKIKKCNQSTKTTSGSQSSTEKKFINNRKSNHKNNSHKITLKSQATASSFHGRSSYDYNNPLKISLQENQQQNISLPSEDNISYRQYCIIGNKWIPLITSTQRNKIFNPFDHLPKKSQINSINKYSQFFPTPNPQSVEQTIEKLNIQIKQNHCFDSFNEEMKKYYSNILLNIVGKLNNENKIDLEQKIRYKENYNEQNLLNDLLNVNEFTCITKNVSPVNVSRVEDTIMKELPTPDLQYQNIINLIKIRQLKQLSLLSPQACPSQSAPSKQEHPISTTLLLTQLYLQKLFETIQAKGFIPQIVSNLKIAWGCPWKQKLTRLKNRKYLGSNVSVMPEQIFSVVLTNPEKQSSIYQFIHDKCLFDCVNNELVKLKPFYESNGETFPWNFRLSSPLTFYDIENNTLLYVFEQIKMKIIEYCNFLCGILVDIKKDSIEYQILNQRRKQRQDLMIKKYTYTQQEKCLQESDLQNQTTLSLIVISDLIFEKLLEEVLSLNSQ